MPEYIAESKAEGIQACLGLVEQKNLADRAGLVYKVIVRRGKVARIEISRYNKETARGARGGLESP